MPRKCALCNEIIKDSEYDQCMPYKKRYVHINCFNASIKAVAVNKKEQLEKKKEEIEEKKSKSKKKPIRTPKAELKDGVSDEEYKEKREYYELLKEVIGTDKLTPKIYTISEGYITKYDMTWTGMRDTVIYLRDIKEKELVGDVVGIIPYYYHESQGFYEELKRVEENNKGIDVNSLYSERVVKFTPPKRKIKQLDF